MATLGDPHSELFLMDQEVSCCLVNKTKSKAIIWKSQFFASQRTTDFPLKKKKSHCYTENFIELFMSTWGAELERHLIAFTICTFHWKWKAKSVNISWHSLKWASIKSSNILEISHITTPFNRYSTWWLSKVITRWWWLRLVIRLRTSRQFFNQREAKLKPVASCMRDSSRTLSKLQVIARNSHWFESRCLLLLWLVGVITLVLLVLRQSFENCSNMEKSKR